MQLPAPTDADIQRIVDLVVAEVAPLRIVLFGSAARGEQRAGSDIDLMVVVQEGADTLLVEQALHVALGRDRRIMVPVDFVVTTPSECAQHEQSIGLVYRQVARTGRDLYAA